MPVEDVKRCRAGCGAFLLRERGEEFGNDPNEIAMRLLLTPTATPNEVEVARTLVWLESRVLYSDGRANEPRARSGGCLRLLKSKRRWLLVEVEAPTSQQLALFREMAAIRRRIWRRIRQFERKFAGLQRDAELLAGIGKQAEAEQGERVVRIVLSELGAPTDGEERVAVGDYCRGFEPTAKPVWAAPVVFYEIGAGFLKVFRGILEPREGRLHYELGLFDLLEPTTLDEWRGARQFLEGALSRAGCSPAELEELLPDGGGERDGAKRAAMRLKRSRKSPGTVLEYNRWLNSGWEQSGRPR